MMSNQARRSTIGSVVLSTLCLFIALPLITLPQSATASSETFVRSVSNMTQGPFDVLLSPITAATGITQKLRDVEDHWAVRAFFVAPGYVWYTGVIIGGGVLRTITGSLELVPGIFLLPFEADMDTLFDPVERAPAMVELDTPCCYNLKFGLDYTSVEY
jgi:hypothetical protein